jgi:hypothetical protein
MVRHRNRATLPPELKLQVNNAYHEIGSWADIVGTGLNPNLGSMQLDHLVSGLATSLPPLIDQLRRVQQLSNVVDDPEPESASIPLPRLKRSRPLEFLPDLNPREIEILVIAARDPSGQISRQTTDGGYLLCVGNSTLMDSHDARTTAELIGAVRTLVSEDLLEECGQNGNRFRVTDSGYFAADLLDDFTRWSTSRVTVEALYMNAPKQSLILACSGVVQLPAVYNQYRIRPDVSVERYEKEPRSLLIQGIELKALNEPAWLPTDLSFVVTETNELKSFLVERTEARGIAKFHIRG